MLALGGRRPWDWRHCFDVVCRQWRRLGSAAVVRSRILKLTLLLRKLVLEDLVIGTYKRLLQSVVIQWQKLCKKNSGKTYT